MSEESKSLRRTMRDMVALSALPAAWVELEPIQIAESLAEILRTTLTLEFVYLRLSDQERATELAYTRQGRQADAARIGRALAPILKAGATDSGLDLRSPIREGDTVRCVRIPIRWEDSEWILVAGSADPAFPTGEDRLMLSVSTNHAAMMLARNLAESSLRESESRYRSVIAAMQEGIVLLAPDGTVRSCNAAGERILGRTEADLLGRKPLDLRWRLIHEDGTTFADDEVPAFVTLRTGRPCSNVVIGTPKADGTLAWLSVNTEPLFNPGGSTLSGVIATFVDISERKRTEEALRASEHRWSSLTGALPQLIWTASPDGTFEDAAAERELARVGPALEELKAVSASILAGIGGVTLEQLTA